MAASRPSWPELRLPPINLWVLAAWCEARRAPQSQRRRPLGARMLAARAGLLPIFYARRARCL